MKKPYCDVYLVRHGETDWNVLGKIQGHTDIPLNSQGLKQALELQEKLQPMDFAGAFCSDLSRARTTAEIILQKRGLALNESRDLRERCFDFWEGKHFKDFDTWCVLKSPSAGFESLDQYLSHKVHHNIESIGETYQRLKNFLLSRTNPYFGSKVLVVTHGGVMRTILDHHLEWLPTHRWSVTNGGLVVLRIGHDARISLLSYEGIVHHEMPSPPPVHEMECGDPWFSLIFEGKKPVEGRKNSPKYRKIKAGDIIEFSHQSKRFKALVERIEKYETLEDYLRGATLEKALPGVRTFEEGLTIYHQWSTPEQIKEAGGFLGIYIKPI